MTSSQYYTLMSGVFVASLLGTRQKFLLGAVYLVLAIVEIILEKLL